MKIYFNNTQVDLVVTDNSYRYRAIKGEHSLTLYYSFPQHIEIPIGAYCVFEGETYTLESPENFKKHNTRNFEYTLIMDSAQVKLGKYKFKDTTTRRLKFSLTAKPKEHLQMIANNMNQREKGWVVGNSVDAVEKVISYNHAFCSDALSQIAEAFETEWEIIGKTINLCKVEYNKENPLSLSYGRGNGFKSGIGRNNGDKKPVEILFVQGGERNIDASKYGSAELLLPKVQTLGYDGDYFSDQTGYNVKEGRNYITDSDGFSLRRSDKPLSSQAEDSLDCSHIYPSRVGTISSVNVVNLEKHFYDIIDSSIPAGLNFEDCLIEGEKMTIIFQSGMLTGKEFDVKYIHKDKRFEIVPQEIDGRTMPDEIFRPQIGQEYAVFGMMMPDAYICDNVTKSGASWNMFREAVKYIYENEEQKFTFTGELDGIWAKKDWLNIGGKIKLGGYVLFTDSQFQPDGVLIRIIGIKDYINNPHSPQIELSNEIVGSSISSDLRKIETNEIVVDDLYKDAVKFVKRRFRDSQETIGMLEDALLDRFTNSISPIAVETMSLLVGDESLQFRFVNNTTNPVEAPHKVEFDPETKILTSTAGILQHLTLGINTLTSIHATNEYKFWTLPEYKTPPLVDGSKKYYLYAKVSKTTTTTGVFYLSETAIAMEGVAGFYHLLMGILNSEFEGERSYVSLYGFTEVLPGRITTDKIVSSDGQNFLDFVNNAFRVGNNKNALEFNTKGDGQLMLKGSMVQSQSGDIQPIGVFRGVYNSAYTYYKGDEVTYNGSTYRYINDTSASNKIPTDSLYWTVVASKGTDGKNGEDGSSGEYTSFIFKASNTKPATPTGTSPIPPGWADAPTDSISIWWLSKATVSFQNKQWLAGAWSVPVKVTGEDGEPGEDGKYWDYKYRVAASQPATPIGLQPLGWNDAPPSITTGNFLWMSFSEKSADQTAIIQEWSVPVRISGEKGEDGKDAGFLNIIADNQVFKYDNTLFTGTPAPATINLRAEVPSSAGTVTWYYLNGVSEVSISTGLTLAIANNATYLSGVAVRTISAKCTWNGQVLTDEMTIVKLGDGADSYTVLLTNESHTVACDANGTPLSGELNSSKSSTSALVYKGTTQLTMSSNPGVGNYSISIQQTTGCTAAIVGSAVNVTAMSSDSAQVNITINCEGKQTYTKVMSLSKSKNGSNGSDGAYFEYRYAKNGSTEMSPSLIVTDANPSGWTTAMPSVGALEYLWMTVAKKTATGLLLQNWSSPVRTSGVKGDKGDSPALVFRGEYSSTGTYYGTSTRVDCVRYSGIYYVTRIDAGNGFSGIIPTNTGKWNTFGAQFESVATNLLLAEMANIAGWIFKNQRLESQEGGAFLDGINGIISVGNDITGKKVIIDTNSTRGAAIRLLSSINNPLATLVIDERKIGTNNRSSGYFELNEYENGVIKSSMTMRPYSLQLSASSYRGGFFVSVNDNGIVNIQMNDLPTSSSGLSNSQIWRDGQGYLRIT